jgi:energy-converting hydrogenase Eha subunit F
MLLEKGRGGYRYPPRDKDRCSPGGRIDTLLESKGRIDALLESIRSMLSEGIRGIDALLESIRGGIDALLESIRGIDALLESIRSMLSEGIRVSMLSWRA